MTITPFRDEVFNSPTGATFIIAPDNFGMFTIHNKSGGIPPLMCQEKFTTYKQAKKEVLEYIEKKTKVTYPDRPSKVITKATSI